jgi:branched-chain amino acid transport system ATP-binding protein
MKIQDRLLKAEEQAMEAFGRTLLYMEDVTVSFDGFRALNNLSFAIAPGEMRAIIGPNGAGKTTMFNLISGDVMPDDGRVTYDGRDITGLPPYRRCRLGIGRSYQIPHPFAKMTVFENMLAGAFYGGRLTDREGYERCDEVLRITGLLPKANVLAGALTLLQRKRLELARALAVGPRLLLLDEIGGGLTEPECLELVETIRTIHRSGIAIVWIEHIVHALVSMVDRLVVIHAGQKLAEGEPHAVMADAKVKEVYVGIPVS